MRPPICAICGRDFRSNSSSGRLIRFADYNPEALGGMVGHPPGAEWFCVLHADLGERHKDLPLGEALPQIRAKSIRNVVALVLGSSALTGFFAVSGSLLGRYVAGTLGLFAGGLLGGIGGVLASAIISAALGILPRLCVFHSASGGVFGFLIAAVLSIGGSTSFGSAFVPAVSLLSVGIGFLLGRRYSARPSRSDPD